MRDRRFIKGSLVALLLFAWAPAGAAEPERLSREAIRPEVMKDQGSVEAFLGVMVGEFRTKIGEAIESGGIARTDEAAVRGAMRRIVPGFLDRTAIFRATLAEPEHRLKLDGETLNLAALGRDTTAMVELVDRWRGWARESLIVSAAEAMIQAKVPFPPELDAMLAEVAASSDEVLVASGRRLADPFAREPVGSLFPDFPAEKTTTDGLPLALARFKGKVLLVDFWATWCGPCRREVPNLVRAYASYKDKGFEIVGISFDKERPAFDEYLKEQGMGWPQYFDGRGWMNAVGASYGVKSIPAMYLLDRDGRVVATQLRGEKLDEELGKLLK